MVGKERRLRVFRSNFVERSILSALSFLKYSVQSDEYALKQSFLQKFEPRLKLSFAALFIIFALFTKSLNVLICLYLFCLLLAVLSGIKLGFFLERTWVFIPLFSLFIALPALFSPGEPLLKFNIWNLVISRQGLSAALLFVARVTTILSYVILLSLTTRQTSLLRSLRVFRVPQIFVMVISMCLRYIYLFAGIIENMFLAIKSRIGGVTIHYKKGQKIATWNLASLWQRSRHLSSQVYDAMLSRGYSGEPRTMKKI